MLAAKLSVRLSMDQPIKFSATMQTESFSEKSATSKYWIDRYPMLRYEPKRATGFNVVGG